MLSEKFKAPREGERFLWVRFGALGDALQAAAEAYLVKRKFPGVSMSFLTAPPYREIIAAQPYIDGVICGEKKTLPELVGTARLMREGKFGWIGSTYRGGRMPWLSLLGGVKNRLGVSRYFQFLNKYNVYDWGKRHGIDLFDRSERCVFAPPESTERAKNILGRLGGRVIFAVIGASLEAKILPHGNWAKILEPLLGDGWGVVLNGHGERENALAERIIGSLSAENAGRALNLVGKLDFVQMSGVALSCDIAVGNDSGPLHMAALGGVPSVGISDYILPPRVGYSMPWFRPVTAFNKPLGNLKNRHRSQSAIAGIPPEIIVSKIRELMQKRH